jgi:serine/threonine protein kinase
MDAASSLHPTDQTLSSYGLGKLDDRLAEAVNQHLEHCPDCRKRVAEMSADSFLARVRDAHKPSGTSTFGLSQAVGAPSSKNSNAWTPPPVDTLPPGLADHPDYEIKRELGRGGMGVVYLAHNKLMGRDEVLKVMGRHILERPGVLERFLREIRAVAKLRHPNIVTAYHAARLGESIVFAMEYVEGLDLSRMVKAKGPLPVAHACSFVHQAALGLQHAYEQGLVHRDIKPGNLMLSRAGDKALVKVLDFGLAKVTREEKVDGGLTSEGQALGTPDFIAPEQIIDAPSADIRADIYSLGCTHYYLLTGRPPFQENSLYDMFQAHISRDADPLNFVRPEVPAELAALVSKMMAKDPARRFQTPGEVALALTPFFKKGSAAFKGAKADVSQAGPDNIGLPVPGAVLTQTERATDAGKMAVRAKKTVEPTATESRWESLIELRETDQSVHTTPEVAPAHRPLWRKWMIALAGSLFGLIALGVIIITIRDKNGRETKITFPDDSSVVIQAPREKDEVRPPANDQEVARVTGTTTPVPRGEEKPTVPKLQGPPSDSAGASKFVHLFNGKDLTGWKNMLPHNGSEWAVVHGVLECRGGGEFGRPAVLLSDHQDFANFRLRIRARYPQAGGGDVEIRLSLANEKRSSYGVYHGAWPTSEVFQGVPGCISKIKEVKFGTGGNFTRVQVEPFPVSANEWHDLAIEAVRNRIAVSLDGKEVSEYTDLSEPYASGAIALGCRFDSVVQFQQIMIEELPGDGNPGNATRPIARAEQELIRPLNSNGDAPAFVPLFNGKDLTGWNVLLRNGSKWEVVGGVLEGRGSGIDRNPAVLVTERRDFANFHLRLKFRYEKAEGGGGIEIRRSSVGGNKSCYLVSHGAWPTTDRWQNPVGSITKLSNHAYGYGYPWEKQAEPAPAAIDTWNALDITAVRNRITASLNGKVVAEHTDPAGWYAAGEIGLFAWYNTVVQFQEILIEELPE